MAISYKSFGQIVAEGKKKIYRAKTPEEVDRVFNEHCNHVCCCIPGERPDCDRCPLTERAKLTKEFLTLK